MDPAPTTARKAPPNETAIAIGASLVISLVLACVIAGSPLRAFHLAFIDYGRLPVEAVK